MEEELEKHHAHSDQQAEKVNPQPAGLDPQKRVQVHPHQPSDSQTDGQVDEHLLQEIIRVRSQEKQKKAFGMWKLANEQLEGFFTNYQLYDGLGLQMKDLLMSKSLKLVKNESRVYFGEIKEQKKHGVGIAIYQDGKVYEGQFNNNEKHGFGYEIYPNCNVYIGDFEKNKKHGRGTFYWFTISSLSPANHEEIEYYRGEWWGGLPSGQGVHRQSNGDICVGAFKNGLKHGEGHENFSNGDSYHGEYINGLPEGYGEYIWSDGSNYKGDFKQGVRNGFGIWKKNNEKNCEAYRGHYLLDRKSGYGVYIWQNGQYYKGDFFQDVRHGYGEFYSNGALVYKGMWENGKEAPNLKGHKRKHHHVHQKQARTNISIVDLSEGDIQLSGGGGHQQRARSNNPNQLRYHPGKNGGNKSRNIGQEQFEETLKRKSPTKQTLATNKQLSQADHHHKYSMNPQLENTAPRHGRVGHRNCIPVQQFGMPRSFHGMRK